MRIRIDPRRWRRGSGRRRPRSGRAARASAAPVRPASAAGSTPARQDAPDAQRRRCCRRRLDRRRWARRWKISSRRVRQVGGHVEQRRRSSSASSAASPAARSANGVISISRRTVAAVATIAARAPRAPAPRRRSWSTSSSPNSRTGSRNEPTMSRIVKSSEKDEAAAAAALEDLALGDQPDARQRLGSSPPSSAPRLAGAADGLHEQLGQRRRLVGEPADLARGAGPREQPVEVDRARRRAASPGRPSLEHRDVAPAVEPGAVGAGHLDLEVPPARTPP